jgi:hypothetical protein
MPPSAQTPSVSTIDKCRRSSTPHAAPPLWAPPLHAPLLLAQPCLITPGIWATPSTPTSLTSPLPFKPNMNNHHPLLLSSMWSRYSSQQITHPMTSTPCPTGAKKSSSQKEWPTLLWLQQSVQWTSLPSPRWNTTNAIMNAGLNSKPTAMPSSPKSIKKMRSSLGFGTAWRAGAYMSESGTCKTASTSAGNLSPSMDPDALTHARTIAVLGQEAQPEGKVMLLPGQAAKLSHCGCDIS